MSTIPLSKYSVAIRRAIWRLSKLGIITVASLVCSANLLAENLEQRLSEGGQAYRQGNYQLAASKLRLVTGFVATLPPNEQIVYWDLLANVDDASGRFHDAEKAAIQHLTLVRQAPTSNASDDVRGESQSLLRVAKIKRSLSQFKDACRLYREALKLPRSDQTAAPLWEADTRFELATTLESLGDSDEATREFSAASRAAETTLTKLSRSKTATDDFLHATTLVRRAYSSHDESGSKRQADKSLAYLKSALQAGDMTPQFRGKLLISAAACYQQLGNYQKAGSNEQIANRSVERRVLERVLSETEDHRSILEPVARAEASIRLAELADLMDPVSRKPGERASTPLYLQAATLYARIRTDAKKPSTAIERGETPGQQQRSQSNLEPSIGDEAECLLRLQLIYTRLAETRRIYWDDAIQKAEELSRLRAKSLSGDDPNYFRTLSALGSLYAMRDRTTRTPTATEAQSGMSGHGDVDKAQKYLARAAEFWRKYEPRSTIDLSSTLNYYAEVCRNAGDFKRADELLNEAEPYYRRLDRHDPAAERQLAEFYLNRGVVQAAIGYFELAQRNYESAAHIAERTDRDDLREYRRLLALIYINEAQLEKSQRHLQSARIDCEKALKAAQKADFSEEDLVPFKLANASLLIAEAENASAQSKSPQSTSDQSPDDNRVDISANLAGAVRLTDDILGRSASEPYLTTARHLQALARYRIFEQDADPSQLRLAEEMWQQIVVSPADAAPQMGALQVRALNYLVQIALRDVRESREQANRLSKLDAPDEARIGELTNQSRTRLEAAKQLSHKAEELAEKSVAYPSVRVQALLARAHVLHAEAQVHQKKIALQPAPQAAEQQLVTHANAGAIRALQNAIRVIEMPRAMVGGADEERADYFAQFRPVFDLLVDLLVEEKRYVEALEIAELRRSRTYQDQLKTSGVDLYATADREKVEAARQARDRYYAALAKLNDNWSNEALRTKILSDLTKLQRDLVKTEMVAKSTSVAARQLLLDQDPSDRRVVEPAAWVHQQIGGDDAALLYYIGSEKSYVFACGRNLGVVGRPLTVSTIQATRRSLPMPSAKNGEDRDQRPLRADDVAQLVREVRDEMDQERRSGSAVRGDNKGLQRVRSGKVDSKTDSLVTDILLPVDLREQISKCGARHVIVVPDGALHQLPLELLPCDPVRNQCLLDILPPMCYAPSLHIYRTLQQKPIRRAETTTLISLANPKYGAVNELPDPLTNSRLSSTGKEYLNRARSLTPLSGTADESKDVRAAFGSLGPERARVVPLLDANASEAKLKENLKDPSIGFLHVAAHGLTSQKFNNLFGALALATPAEPSAEDDGFLSLYEVYELDLRSCELAVLSACETNCGQDSPLEAGSTMARAFICAGSRRVVCSHWDVSDQATAPLVGRFMQRVAHDFRDEPTVDYATALHAAKKTLRDDPQTSAPWLWAPFVLIGPPTGSSAGGHRANITAEN